MIMKKEEILKKWRDLGFLKGFKEGSINEWRCAKSYDDLTNYLMEQEWDDKTEYLSIMTMPFIHRALATGKKRLYRFIKPDELISFLQETTLNDISTYITTSAKKKKNDYELQLCKNIANSKLYNSVPLFDFLYGTMNGTGIYEYLKYFFYLVIDVEATFLAFASDYFVEIKS